MDKKLRWMVSIFTGTFAVPAGYAALVMLCGPSVIASLPMTAAVLVLIP
jgi:hypothetical protein